MEARNSERGENAAQREAVIAGGRRDGVLVAAVVVGAALLAWPFAATTFGDDFSYGKTALDFAQQGRLIYNGWASMLLGWQAVWGALFIRIFGFSFNILRLSMLPVAGATVYLMHRVLLRFGVHRRNAVFGALTLGLTPLFLPLVPSFMSDLPGLLSVLLCLRMCQRAVAARTDRATVMWLMAASATNVLTGTVRQICWLGALVMMPATAYLLRRRRGVPVAAAVSWMVSAGCVLWCIRWLNRQPWTVPEHVLMGPITALRMAHLGTQLIKAGLVMVLVTAPVNVGFAVLLARRDRRRACLLAVSVVVIAAISVVVWKEGVLAQWAMPWLWPMLDSFGPGQEPALFRWPTRVVITVLTVAMALVLASEWDLMRSVRAWKGSGEAQVRLALLGPFSLAVLAMIAPRGMYLYLQDRYLLLLLPAVLVLTLLSWQRAGGGDSMPFASWCVLLVLGGYSIAAIHDEYASMRAEVQVVEQAKAHGVPRDEIAFGFGPDEWYEVSRTGHVNSPAFAGSRLGSYRADVPAWPLPPSCVRFDWELSPSVRPRWFVASSPGRCFVPGPFSPITWQAWLPPFRRARQLMGPAKESVEGQ